MNRAIRIGSIAAAALVAAAPALAHHPMGGATPQTLMHGLLSGFGHPVIGIDHLAFIVIVGLASAFTPNRLLTPLAFILGTIAGCLLLVAGTALPLTEFVVSGSAVVVGAMVLSGRRFSTSTFAVLFAIAGLFHGSAYAEAILGAETTPLVAYLVGFAAIQYAIAVGSGWLVTTLGKASDPQAIAPRLAGAVATGIGFAFLVENIEGVVFG